MSSSRSRACRLGIAFLVASLALAGAAGAAVSVRADGAAPQITLLAPANESKVPSDVSLNTYPTFRWRVDWTQPPTSGVVRGLRRKRSPRVCGRRSSTWRRRTRGTATSGLR